MNQSEGSRSSCSAEADWLLRPFHPPLRRVSRGPRVPVSPSDVPLRMLAPAISAPLVLTTVGAAAANKLAVVNGNKSSTVEPAQQQDSCYGSSCSDSDHSSLSRETSENSAGGGGKQASPEAASTPTPSYGKLRDYTLKLGYSERQLVQVLDNLAASSPNAAPDQDKVLSELVKLGKSGGRAAGHTLLTASNSCNLPPSIPHPHQQRHQHHQKSAVQQQSRCVKPVIIDGTDVAMTHGGKEVFSSRGIVECVNYFRQRSQRDLKVYVPQFRREPPRSNYPISEQHLLFELENEGLLVWTPARRLGDRRFVCHDNRYILKAAAEKDAVILSNDEYRELTRESAAYRYVVDQRLLRYAFVDGSFELADETQGRLGSRFDLAKGGGFSEAQPCPYAKKCTYGSKCKYFHADRPAASYYAGPCDTLAPPVKNPLNSAFSLPWSVVETNSSAAEAAQRGGGQPQQQMAAASDQRLSVQQASRSTVGRTRSLNLPVSISVAAPSSAGGGAELVGWPAPAPSSGHVSPYSLLVPSKNPLSRNLSAPIDELGFGLGVGAAGRKSSTSDSQLYSQWPAAAEGGDEQTLSDQPTTPAPLWRAASSDSAFGGSEGVNCFVPSSLVWGPSEFSVVGTPSGGGTAGSPRPPSPSAQRQKLHYHLSQLFPDSAVSAVMMANPSLTNPQLLCSKILAFQKGFDQQTD